MLVSCCKTSIGGTEIVFLRNCYVEYINELTQLIWKHQIRTSFACSVQILSYVLYALRTETQEFAETNDSFLWVWAHWANHSLETNACLRVCLLAFFFLQQQQKASVRNQVYSRDVFLLKASTLCFTPALLKGVLLLFIIPTDLKYPFQENTECLQMSRQLDPWSGMLKTRESSFHWDVVSTIGFQCSCMKECHF